MSESAALVLGHITIRDTARWAEYRALVPATLIPWGGELLFRGEDARVLSGNHSRANVVALRFPSAEAAEEWYRSAGYQALIPLRESAADVDLVLYRT